MWVWHQLSVLAIAPWFVPLLYHVVFQQVCPRDFEWLPPLVPTHLIRRSPCLWRRSLFPALPSSLSSILDLSPHPQFPHHLPNNRSKSNTHRTEGESGSISVSPSLRRRNSWGVPRSLSVLDSRDVSELLSTCFLFFFLAEATAAAGSAAIKFSEALAHRHNDYISQNPTRMRKREREENTLSGCVMTS
jgi:hypothetical protein